jgi:hypothetical protein
MLVPVGPCLGYPLHYPFGFLAEKEVTARLFACRSRFGVLIDYSTPSFITAIYFNEEMLPRHLVPKVQRSVSHHGLDVMTCNVIVRAMNPLAP